MFKNIVLSFLIFNLTYGVFNPCLSQSNWQEFGFHGKVKFCLERHHEPIKILGVWENGELERFDHNVISFNDQGKFIGAYRLNDDLEVFEKSTPKYENGLLVEVAFFDKDSTLSSKVKIEHISKNEDVSDTYFSDGEKFYSMRRFYENGKVMNLIATQYDGKEVSNVFDVAYFYNNEGNLIKETQTNQKDEYLHETTYKYVQFDKHKNWTKKLVYKKGRFDHNGEPESVVTRNIQYY